MKLLLTLATLLTLASLTSAQTCPYTVSFTPYGSSCSTISATPPTLTYPGFPPGPGCDETIRTNVPVLAGYTVTDRILVVGLTQTSLTLANGCTQLASFDDIITLPALEGEITLTLLLAEDPALIGLTVYLQAIDRRREDATGLLSVETSNGLRVDFL